LDRSRPLKSDASCFVAEADRSGPSLYPCYLCGSNAKGATFREFFSHPSSKTSGVVQFSCGCDGQTSFGISVQNVFPQWRILTELAPGVYKIVKKTKVEREQEFRGESAS
jgi:hypothetical protein